MSAATPNPGAPKPVIPKPGAMKRFWDHATLAERDGGWAVMLDGKPMRIPGGSLLLLPGRALADAVAAEWQAAGGSKGGTLSMDDVPLTRLAGTAQDRIAPNPGLVVAELARYAETDLLCYRAEHPDALVVRQVRAWQPWLDWMDRTHGVRLEPTEGILHRKQDAEALARVHALMAEQTPATLAALGIAVPALGSAVLGLALAGAALDAAEAHRLAILDEMFTVENWGDDAEARKRRDAVGADVALAERFIRLGQAP